MQWHLSVCTNLVFLGLHSRGQANANVVLDALSATEGEVAAVTRQARPQLVFRKPLLSIVVQSRHINTQHIENIWKVSDIASRWYSIGADSVLSHVRKHRICCYGEYR